MKTLLIICGAGHATSTVVRAKIEQWLRQEHLSDKVVIKQSAVSDEVDNIAKGAYDIVVSTTQVPISIQHDVISGLALLTGFATEPVFKQLRIRIEA